MLGYSASPLDSLAAEVGAAGGAVFCSEREEEEEEAEGAEERDAVVGAGCAWRGLVVDFESDMLLDGRRAQPSDGITVRQHLQADEIATTLEQRRDNDELAAVDQSGREAEVAHVSTQT